MSERISTLPDDKPVWRESRVSIWTVLTGIGGSTQPVFASDIIARIRALQTEVRKLKARAVTEPTAHEERLAKQNEALQEENRFLISEWQRLQPGGSPPPGGPIVLVPWIRVETAKRLEALQERVRELNSIAADAVAFLQHRYEDTEDCTVEIQSILDRYRKLTETT